MARKPAALPSLKARLAARWPIYLAGAVLALYVLVFLRGLAWQWQGIFAATRASVPIAASGPPGGSGGSEARGVGAPGPVVPGASGGARAAPGAGAKAPLPPTDEPPPRDTADGYGVYYDKQGVAVMGIDTDPNGVYNVPPGRQVRIGGPSGDLYDVLPGGKIARATRVKEWPG